MIPKKTAFTKRAPGWQNFNLEGVVECLAVHEGRMSVHTVDGLQELRFNEYVDVSDVRVGQRVRMRVGDGEILFPVIKNA
jgi:hypothetical protein